MRQCFIACGLLLATAFLIHLGSRQDALAQSTPSTSKAVPLTPAVKAAPPTKVVVGPDGKPMVIEGEGAPGAPAEAKVAEKPKESERLKKLKTISFDRRPSAQLKAWAPEAKKDDNKAAPPKDPKEAELDAELKTFRKIVTLGEWTKVKEYLGTLPDEEAIVAYKQLTNSMMRNPMMMQNSGGDDENQPRMMGGNPNMMRFAEKNLLTIDDFLGIAAAAPKASNPKFFDGRATLMGTPMIVALAPAGIGKPQLQEFTSLLSITMEGGTLPEVVVARLKAEVAKPNPVFDKRQVAKMFINGSLSSYAGDFMPTLDQAKKDNDFEALNLLSQYYLALQDREEKSGNLERAWGAVQSVLAVPDSPREQQEEALMRAVQLAPRVTEKLGQAWLAESFTQKPERGMNIIATVGTLVSTGITSRPFQTDDRVNSLKLMKTAVEGLLEASPAKAKEWQPTLTALAVAWLKEAEFSQQYDRSSGSGPRLRRDVYGNIFYSSSDDDDDGMSRMMMMQQQQGMPRPVSVGDVLRARPNDKWVMLVSDSVRPRLADVLARMHLKVGEEDKAFPLIEEIAKNQKNEAKELVKEFIRVWTKNHDPNARRNENRYSWFFFSYETRSESIPLTRSKQERNLEELAGWLKRIRALPIPPLDDTAIVKAFTTCHSSAEVYKTESIEKVFGPISQMQPKTIAGFAEQMRTNLVGLWRDDRQQQSKKTNRKKKDLEAEILRGYSVAQSVVSDGLKKFPNHFALLSVQASLLHDELNYSSDLAKTTEFSKKRDIAFDIYAKAAAEYGKVVKTIPDDEQSNEIFDSWFAASLGAVDLGMITEERQPDLRQAERIKKALLALPTPTNTKHFDRFANDLFTRLSGAKPHVKFRYLKSGFEIVGDHKQAVEAKKLFDYYKDLVTEIQLDAIPDGPTDIGHTKPFGIFVNIRHTRDIERESGGFSRYLQNQNSMSYSYNYGRPTTDYRDRFEKAAKEALKENFEVLSVTFQTDKVTSRATQEYGWRYTPYAYILLKPRGPQVDRIPELHLDLDFLDTSGFVVMPVNSKTIPINCREPKGPARPVKDLEVIQTLDERQASKGELGLEVKAQAIGLIPDFEDLGKFAPEGFEIDKIEDSGNAVKKFDEDATENSIVCERVWNIKLKGKSGLAELPKTFSFADIELPTKEKSFQRYEDANLTRVEQLVSLEKSYGKKSNLPYILAGVIALGALFLAGLVLALVLMRKPAPVKESAIPKDVNAFTLLQFLESLDKQDKIPERDRADWQADLTTIEAHYFGDTTTTPPDLAGLARKWAKYA
ncbi:MAG: hypothetical protein ACRC8S_23265 [Fimbriiglobus sp.]